MNNPHDVFSHLIHPIVYPKGETEESLLKYLKGFKLDGNSENELVNYLTQDFKRFVYTLGLIPEGVGSLLEIGSNPYFTSILLEKYTNYSLSYTNWFGVSSQDFGKQVCRNLSSGEVYEFNFAHHNIDEYDIPFKENFDIILFCEVLEHLINDPMQALLRIKKSLKKNGILILTTPNVSRLENIAKMIQGLNIYDPYSGYGVYGRHNREYNKHELYLLLSHLGFEIEEMFASDVHMNDTNAIFEAAKIADLLKKNNLRNFDLGQYIFIKAKNVAPARTCKPNWLFRSYPENELC